MKNLNASWRLLARLVPICLALTACGGGGGGGGDNNAGAAYTAATSASFSPTTAKDKASKTQDVALHWVYVMNNGQPITASLLGATVSVTVDSLEVTLSPADLKRQVALRGAVSGSVSGTVVAGSYSATVGEDLAFSSGKTVFKNQTAGITLTVSGGGESATAQLTSTIKNFTPPYEWLLDRATLDQLAVGYSETVTSSGSADLNVTITDESPIVRSNLPVAISERWSVLEKLPSMVVRGKTYTSVVRLSRLTKVPDFNGNLVTVTIYYWVAKGVGMIKGQGVYSVLNLSDVIVELVDTNLSQI